LGLAQISGEPVALVDLQSILDGGSTPAGHRDLTVVIRGPRSFDRIGLAIDEALGVIEVTQVSDAAAGDPPCVEGHALIGGRHTLVIDPVRFFVNGDGETKGAFDAD
jgi:chemotaxis signal transduction protein